MDENVRELTLQEANSDEGHTIIRRALEPILARSNKAQGITFACIITPPIRWPFPNLKYLASLYRIRLQLWENYKIKESKCINDWAFRHNKWMAGELNKTAKIISEELRLILQDHAAPNVSLLSTNQTEDLEKELIKLNEMFLKLAVKQSLLVPVDVEFLPTPDHPLKAEWKKAECLDTLEQILQMVKSRRLPIEVVSAINSMMAKSMDGRSLAQVEWKWDEPGWGKTHYNSVETLAFDLINMQATLLPYFTSDHQETIWVQLVNITKRISTGRLDMPIDFNDFGIGNWINCKPESKYHFFRGPRESSLYEQMMDMPTKMVMFYQMLVSITDQQDAELQVTWPPNRRRINNII